ncbi:DUF6279 family lipoprotein [Eleftheria terrae]|uniref:DUF6279 family lipoprotein n=1 Tax=Eleftheria terrae TaxID=1597781 RepID=UPI00263B2CD4|nr:DUF6279 family lipoprotein [Eleftheria terrae]WKB50651.1 DUF6279 family lipoprotein [Eleftheria terrae]
MLLVLLSVLSGCSSLRLAYGQGPTVAYWWLDDYVDFHDAQRPQAREALASWFSWHRKTQLPLYVQALAQVQQEALRDGTAAQACQWWIRVQRWRDEALEQALPAMADLALRLTPEQLQHLEARYAKSNQKFRKEHLQEAPDERLRARLKRSLERAEDFYGRLDTTQRHWLAQRMQASPFDAELAQRERLRRQQDILQSLRSLQASQPGAEQARHTVRELVQRLLTSPDANYRAYQERLTAYNCELVAELHNRTTPSQRKRAQGQLYQWEQDLRALSAMPGH